MEKGKVTRELGRRQQEILAALTELGGAGSAGEISQKLHLSARATASVLYPALYRLQVRGMVKSYYGGDSFDGFTPDEAGDLQAAMLRSPRASRFWVVRS